MRAGTPTGNLSGDLPCILVSLEHWHMGGDQRATQEGGTTIHSPFTNCQSREVAAASF